MNPGGLCKLHQSLVRCYMHEVPTFLLQCVLSALPQKVLCQLVTEEDDVTAQALMKHMGVPAKEYQAKVLKKVRFFFFFTFDLLLSCNKMTLLLLTVIFPSFQIVATVQENIEKSSQNDIDER